VLNGIQSLDVGQGLEAGIGIVILAVVLDRITQGFGGRGAGVEGAARANMARSSCATSRKCLAATKLRVGAGSPRR